MYNLWARNSYLEKYELVFTGTWSEVLAASSRFSDWYTKPVR